MNFKRFWQRNNAQGVLRPRAPARTLVALFLAVIALVMVLLQPPISGREGSVGWSTALFTATSAVCVTGLSVINVASTFSLFGQIVLLLLIQVGGLGYMLASTLLFLLLGGEMGLSDRLILRDTRGQVSLRDTRRVVLRAIKFTFFAEGVSALLLWILFWHSRRYDGLTALWQGITWFRRFATRVSTSRVSANDLWKASHWLSIEILAHLSATGYPLVIDRYAPLKENELLLVAGSSDDLLALGH